MAGRRTSAPRRTNGSRDRGAALVEFAIVGTLLFTLLFGIIDYGYMLNRDSLVNNAAREGAREGSLNPDQSDITDVVHAELSNLDPADITVNVDCRKPDGTACSSFASDAAPGGVVIVEVIYDHGWLSFVPRTAFGDSISLSKTIEMRIE